MLFATKRLSRQTRVWLLSRQKTCFVATKIILVADPANVAARRLYVGDFINKFIHRLDSNSCVCSLEWGLTASLLQPLKFPGRNMHGRAYKQYISGPITHLLSMLCVCYETPFTCHCKKGNKNTEEFQVSHVYWSFSSDSKAMKGLK